MARVLVAHADEAVRDALTMALADVAGHLVLATSGGQLSVAALRLSDRPMVALLDERLVPFSALDILRLGARDRADGELGRHRYIVLSSEPANATEQWLSLLTRLHAPVLALPVELDNLIELVDEVDARHNLSAAQLAGSTSDVEHRSWDALM